MRRTLVIAALASVLAAAFPARPSALSLRLGADALLNGGPGVFSLGLGVESAAPKHGLDAVNDDGMTDPLRLCDWGRNILRVCDAHKRRTLPAAPHGRTPSVHPKRTWV